MKPQQFDALVQLMGAGRMSPNMRAALCAFFCSNPRPLQKDLAARHGVSPNGLNQRIAHARETVLLAYNLLVAPDETDTV